MRQKPYYGYLKTNRRLAPFTGCQVAFYFDTATISGTTMNDQSGNERHGTLQGSPTVAADGVVFDADGKYVTLASALADATGIWTVQFAFKNYTRTENHNRLCGRLANATTNSLSLCRQTNNTITYRTTSNYTFGNTSSNLNTAFNTLQFVANATTVKLYINGIYINEVTPNTTVMDIIAFCGGSETNSFINAKACDFRKYDRALTVNEILAYHQHMNNYFKYSV